MTANCPHCGKPIAALSALGGLTRQQQEALDYIRAHIGVAGVSPSYAEIMDGLGLKSLSGVSRLLDALEERGRIRRLPSRARAIELLGSA